VSNFVWLVVLLAWGADGLGTPDSGRFGDPTLSDCHERSLTFSHKHNTPIQLCVKISKASYRIIASAEVEFDFTGNPSEVVVPDENTDSEVKRLTDALKEIGKWHRGKTQDSHRVRAIIEKALR